MAAGSFVSQTLGQFPPANPTEPLDSTGLDRPFWLGGPARP